MMMFWKAGLVLLAIPKTGTQAYAAALSDGADMVIRHPTTFKHMTAQRFDRKLRPLLPSPQAAQLETVAVIRAPIDWLGSWFRYRGRAQLAGQPNSTAGLEFDDFVTGYLERDPPPWAQIGSQHRFVSGKDGRILVDHLFPYEDQTRLRAFLSHRLGRDVPRPELRNVSPTRTLTLSPATEARLRAERAEDFALHKAVSAAAASRE